MLPPAVVNANLSGSISPPGLFLKNTSNKFPFAGVGPPPNLIVSAAASYP